MDSSPTSPSGGLHVCDLPLLAGRDLYHVVPSAAELADPSRSTNSDWPFNKSFALVSVKRRRVVLEPQKILSSTSRTYMREFEEWDAGGSTHLRGTELFVGQSPNALQAIALSLKKYIRV